MPQSRRAAGFVLCPVRASISRALMILFSVLMWGTSRPGREDLAQPAEDEHAGEASGETLNPSFIYIRHQPGHCRAALLPLGFSGGFMSVGR